MHASGQAQRDDAHPFMRVCVPEGCTLVRKEQFEYVTPSNRYRVELFQQQDGRYYAIGVPLEGDRLIVYGTPVVPDAERALTALIDKIQKESAFETRSAGDPARTDADDAEGAGE